MSVIADEGMEEMKMKKAGFIRLCFLVIADSFASFQSIFCAAVGAGGISVVGNIKENTGMGAP